MALGFTSKTSALDPANGSSYTLNSVSYVAGRVYYLGLLTFDSGGASELATVSGPGGLSWVTEVSSISGTNAVSWHRAVPGSDVTGSIGLTYGSTMNGIAYCVIEVTGANTSTPTVAGSASSNSNTTGTSGTVTMPTFASANNHALGFMTHNHNEPTTPGTGFTELADVNGLMQPSSGNRGVQAQHKANDNTVDFSWATSSPWRAVAIEVAEATAADQTVETPLLSVAPSIHQPEVSGGDAAVTTSLLANGSFTSPSTEFITSSINTTTGTVLYMAVSIYAPGGASVAPSSIVGPGTLTWTKVNEVITGAAGITVWQATPPTGASGTVTITFPSLIDGIQYGIVRVSDVSVAPTTVSSATNADSGSTALTVTLPAFSNSANLALGFIQRNASDNVTPGTGFTELLDVAEFLGPPSSGQRNFQIQHATNDNTVDWSWSGSTSSRAVAVEVAFNATAPGTITVPVLDVSPTIHSPFVQTPGTTSGWNFRIFPVCGAGACNSGSVSPYNSSRVVTWGDLGGPFYTQDGGLSWDMCRSGLNDTSPQHTGGAVEWSTDATKPNRVWAITSGGVMVSNTWPPTWSVFNTAIQFGQHGDRPRNVGGGIADTGTGIVYFVTTSTVRRYNVSGANGDAGSFTTIASGLSGCNAVTFDPNGTTAWAATANGVFEIPNANTRTSAGGSLVSGLGGQTWDLEAVNEGGATFVYVASHTNKVRRYNASSGAVQSIGSAISSGEYCSLVTRRSGGQTFLAVGCNASVQTGGNFQQWWTTPNAATGSPTWTCVTLDNANMDVIETEGPGGETYFGYLSASAGGSTGNKIRDESTYTPHDSSLSADGRFLFAFSTGGVYRFDFDLKRVYPVMHQLGTTSNTNIRTHPTDPSFIVVPNTDHNTLYSTNTGQRWLKNERWGGSGPSPFPGTTEGTYCTFDPGANRAVIAGVGARGSNSGGNVVYTPNITTTAYDTLNPPVGVHPGCMDARRVGSTLYVFVGFAQNSLRRYSAPVSNPLNGSWVTCGGTAFTSGAALQNGDIRWASDGIVYAFDKAKGLFRCTNPTAASPTFSLIFSITANFNNNNSRDGFMRHDETSVGRVFISIPSNGSLPGLHKFTGADSGTPTRTEMTKSGGGSFTRAGVMDVKGGVVYLAENKNDAGADASIWSGSVTGTTLTNIGDNHFNTNHSKQSDMAVNADSTRIFVSGRGGGIWGATRGLSAPADQVIGTPLHDAAPVIHPPDVSQGGGAGMVVVTPLVSVAPTIHSPSVSQSGTPTQNVGVPLLVAGPTIHAPGVVREGDPDSPAASPTKVRRTRKFPKP